MSLKVVHKKLGPADEVKALWEQYEKKFWNKKTTEKIETFLTGTRDVKGRQKGSIPALS